MEDLGREIAEAGAQARALVRGRPRAALSTIVAGEAGQPFGSLVLCAATQEGEPLLLLSDLAEHARNIRSNPRVSLLLDGTGDLEDPLEGARASVQGRAYEDAAPLRRERFLRRHPKARAYAGFGDFRLYRVEVEAAHLVAGFGRIRWAPRGDLLVEPAPRLARAEGALVRALEGERAERLGALAGGGAAGGWRATGVDPEGVDLRRGARTARLAFPARAEGPRDAKRMLRELEAGV